VALALHARMSPDSVLTWGRFGGKKEWNESRREVLYIRFVIGYMLCYLHTEIKGIYTIYEHT
jgi:hypothetical protein